MEKTVTIRGVPEATLEVLRRRAQENRRSLNSELLTVLDAAAKPFAGSVREATALYARPDVARIPDAAVLEDVCTRWGIRRIALFGSHAAGTAHSGSDVDLLVEFEPGRTPGFDLVRVADALRPLFGGARVDLHTPASLSPTQRERAERSSVPLYE